MRLPFGLDRYQWTVLLSAWLGWGFDVFDAMLFNLVAPNCIPTLLGIPLGTPEARATGMFWTGVMTALLLVGWAVGGVIFGKVADRLGRRRTMLITISLYSVGTALCATAPNLWIFAACRFAASLGLGGEWAAGASMVAEVVPEERRVEAGALLQTAAPLGLLSVTLVNYVVAGHLLPQAPQVSWRLVFLFGLLPAAVVLLIRRHLREPERWQAAQEHAMRPSVGELFSPPLRHATWSGMLTGTSAQLTWWSTYAFIPTVAAGLAAGTAAARGLDAAGAAALAEGWKTLGTSCFNIGGLVGTLLLIPATRALGRRGMLATYFGVSFATVLAANQLPLEPGTRLYMNFPIGLSVYGIIGAFTFYLSELFPTRLRATGAGFCFNFGRLLAAAGPFLVGAVASRQGAALAGAMGVLSWVSLVPLITLLLVPTIIETRNRVLPP